MKQMTTLPVLVLSYPRVLFPTARLIFPVDQPTTLAIQELLHKNPDERPHVLAIPALATLEGADIQLAEMGVVARVARVVKMPTVRGNAFVHFVHLHGVGVRARFTDLFSLSPENVLRHAKITPIGDDKFPSNNFVEPFRSAALVLLGRLAADPAQSSRNGGWRKVREIIEDMTEPNVMHLADMLLSGLEVDHADKLEFLIGPDNDARLVIATKILVKYNSISEVSQKIASDVNETLSKQQKEFYLRQQLAAIQRELAQLQGSGEDHRLLPGSNSSKPMSELDNDSQQDQEELDDMRRKIEALEKDSEERKVCVREWKRMKRAQPSSVEQGVIRSYLEWIVALPWLNTTSTTQSDDLLTDPLFLNKTKRQLDADHFGLEKIKRRLIEYLAVVRLKRMQVLAQENQLVFSGAAGNQDAPTPTPSSKPRLRQRGVKGPILLFVGPPGVGKTSLGQSVARALNRPFQRVSLGGVRDEAEIRGHRRTYVASGPGVIVSALRKAGRLDPVILLDEIDKLAASNNHGDPGAALLEVLDPEQNHAFNDHYINVPIDLSQVLFICTANSLDTISAPLLDRCEVIHLAGYTHEEKLRIARRFLLPKQTETNALTSDHMIVTDSALKAIVTGYTHEAGCRSLERSIGSVARHKALEWAESQSSLPAGQSIPATSFSPIVEEHHLESILGVPLWNVSELHRKEHIGTVYGLVVSGAGEGSVLPVETAAVPGSGKLKLTGSLGDIIKESAEIALSWVRAHAYSLGVTSAQRQDPLQSPQAIDIHLHLPSGAQRKDGPSAGIAMVCAFVSLLTGLGVPTHTAMTGEVTLRGCVAPVGGIKEKVLGAHRAGIKTVILPLANKKDVEHDITLEVRQHIKVIFVHTIEDVIDAAFGKGKVLNRLHSNILVDSRL